MSETVIFEKFGTRVKELRLAAGHSQESFAFHCGIDRTYISSVERGRRNVSLKNIERIAKALDIDIASLMAGI